MSRRSSSAALSASAAQAKGVAERPLAKGPSWKSAPRVEYTIRPPRFTCARWSKAFIQERERFDGADVLHLLRETAPSLDWPRLLMRFGDYWRVLLSHLILFGFVYPDKRHNIPAWVTDELVRRLSVSRTNLNSDVCYGTLLSREQYIHDIEQTKYKDSRLEVGAMAQEEIEIWTAAIADKEKH